MTPSRIIRVYVAGPYTHPDPVENTNRAILVGDDLYRRGYVPYIPHLNLAWHLVCPRPAQDWYRYDLYWMAKCDVVLRLEGASVGADKEEQVARSLGISVVYSIEQLTNNFPLA